MGKTPRKKPKITEQPQKLKRASHVEEPKGFQDQRIAWHFSCMDNEGEWPCSIEIIAGIFDRLKKYESMKWSEIVQDKRNHPWPLTKIPPKAQSRLTELKYDDEAKIYQLAIEGPQRLWGLRRKNIFQILWWDPDHTVYPVEKRNT